MGEMIKPLKLWGEKARGERRKREIRAEILSILAEATDENDLPVGKERARLLTADLYKRVDEEILHRPHEPLKFSGTPAKIISFPPKPRRKVLG